jgi:hypothetical protein
VPLTNSADANILGPVKISFRRRSLNARAAKPQRDYDRFPFRQAINAIIIFLMLIGVGREW